MLTDAADLRLTRAGDDDGVMAFWHLEDEEPVVRHVVMTLTYCGFAPGPQPQTGGIGHELIFRRGADLATARRLHPTLGEIWDAVEREHITGRSREGQR
ncbi:hypothetical protein [Nocardia bovistercoris]|uniref:Uncharacterized protein n=1 Tax=Nocardia bovistercoris TaxID=2785916 RepID=A0A931IBW7_9NOCA|nr:hypothetical protein [Nocardia bovistercoris]MBH0778782.1 hypothetical protein [Nocardia bovistercoris]